MTDEPEAKLDGQYDAEVGKHKCVEEVTTKIADDGVEETHIDYRIKQPSQWTFAMAERTKKRYAEIDWTK